MDMQLIYVCQSFSEASGWGRLARSMTQEALRAGYRVYTCSADGTGVEGAQSGPSVFRVHAPLWKKIFVAVGWWMRTRLFLINNKTSLHFFSEQHFWLVLGLPAIPSVGTISGTYVDSKQHGSWLSAWLFRKSLDSLRHVVAVSDYTRSRARAPWREKMLVVPNGVAEDLLDRPWRAVNWNADAIHRIVSVGAIKPRKGFLALIHGFKRWSDAHPKQKMALAIIGSLDPRQPYVGSLQQAIIDLNLIDRVKLVGSVTDEELYGWYRWSDAFALTPIDDAGGFEGFGLVYLEANVFGKPCLGVAGTGAMQAIGSSSGVLASSIQPEDIQRGLEALFDPAATWQPQDWARSHSWAKVFQVYQPLYES